MSEAGIRVKEEEVKKEAENVLGKIVHTTGGGVVGAWPYPNPSNNDTLKYCVRCGKKAAYMYNPASMCHTMRCLCCVDGNVFDMEFRIIEQHFQERNI